MKIETKIKLNRFKPREYQLPILDALEHKGYKKVIAIMPRRAGKDVVAFNYTLRQALRKIGVYYYCFPTFSQARRVIWDSITNEGKKFLDFIPEELIANTNATEMKITLTNGSIIQLVGSDNYDRLMGSNCMGIVYSEYALQDPRAYQLLRPILAVSDGWTLVISTPRGKNHCFELFQIATNSPDWFAYHLTVEDTQHVSLHEIEKDIACGEMSRDMAMQEYWCSFEFGQLGSYYQSYIDKMRINGQIGVVPWEPNFPVHTSWDLGMADNTVIIFFQVIGNVCRIIDIYENHSQGLQWYAKIISQKPYSYGKHIAPHDIAVRELGTGMSRLEQARNLGLKFITAPNLMIEDGIEAVRNMLGKTWIDEGKCGSLIKSLENYRREYDEKREVYKDQPLHNWASHMADAARYMALSLPKTRDGLSAEALDKRYEEAVYGKNANMPSIFRDDLPNNRF